MIRHDLPAGQWAKSSYSGGQRGNCIEYQLVGSEGVAMGDSKDRALGAFVFPSLSWISFINAVKSGDLGK